METLSIVGVAPLPGLFTRSESVEWAQAPEARKQTSPGCKPGEKRSITNLPNPGGVIPFTALNIEASPGGTSCLIPIPKTTSIWSLAQRTAFNASAKTFSHDCGLTWPAPIAITISLQRPSAALMIMCIFCTACLLPWLCPSRFIWLRHLPRYG